MSKRLPNPRIFTALTFVTVLVGAGLCYMEWGKVGEQQAKIEALRKQGVDAKTVNELLDQSQTDLSQLQTKLAHLEQGVPMFAYVPTMLKELESTGKQHKIEVLGVRPVPKQQSSAPSKDKKPARKPYEELDIEVKGRGQYGDVLRFVTALNTFPKIVAARTVSIEPKIETVKDVTKRSLEVTVLLRAYLFKDRGGPKNAMKPEVQRNG